MGGIKKKILFIVGIVGLFFVYRHYELGQYLTFDYLKNQREVLEVYYNENQFLMIISFFSVYVLATALSIPGAIILTLAAGAIFGVVLGTVIVSFASTIGSTLAFLSARLFLRDMVESKFPDKLKTINDGVEKEGAFYLFTLRLIPVVPFFVINLSMGLTKIKTLTYFFVSQLGMFAGTVVYVNAGTQLSQLESLQGILSPKILLSFVLLGIFPLIAKKIVSYVQGRKYLKRYKKPKKFDYNVVAIGGGAGGLVTSYISAAVKAKVALIEKGKMGGDCLNYGCVPSKAIIKTSKIVQSFKRAKEFGIKNVQYEMEFSEVMDRVHRVIAEIEPHDSMERYRSLGVDCIAGEAMIKSPYEIEVNGKTITTKNIVVAAGAAPFVPPIKGIEKIKYLTSDNIWQLRELPKKMIVLGGGPIGSELTQAFNRLGANVTQIERGARIISREDEDVSELIAKKFEKEGVKVLTNHDATEFVVEDGKNFLICKVKDQDQTVKIEFDQILIAVGRAARVKGYGLEDLDIKLTKRKTIEVNEFLQTNYPNIFACGDIAGPYQFTHTAAHQAWYAAVNALFGTFKKFKVDYRVIPWCTYSDPEIARVGLNEIEAKEKNIAYELTTYGLDDLDRAITEEETEGFVKVLTVPGKDKILGVTIVGHHAGDYIAEYVSAMKQGFGMNAILGTIHIYPTLAEANKYAAGNWKKAHTPEKLLGWVEKLHTWRRG